MSANITMFQLLNDGRVLISGSDPQTFNPDGTAIFPEELRLEVYVPPYLSQGLTQPKFTIQQTDWAYGGSYQIQVNLFHGTTSTMRVSLMAGMLFRLPRENHRLQQYHSCFIHTWKLDGSSHDIPRIPLQRQHVHDRRAAQCECFSSGLASTLCPRWANSFLLPVGAHRRRPCGPWSMAQSPRLQSPGCLDALRAKRCILCTHFILRLILSLALRIFLCLSS